MASILFVRIIPRHLCRPRTLAGRPKGRTEVTLGGLTIPDIITARERIPAASNKNR